MVEKERVRTGYNDIAETYLADRSPSEEEREALTRFLDTIPNDARVLDAGCGGGDPVLNRLGPRRAVGLDFSSAQLDIASETARLRDWFVAI